MSMNHREMAHELSREQGHGPFTGSIYEYRDILPLIPGDIEWHITKHLCKCWITSHGKTTECEDGPWELGMGNEVALEGAWAHWQEVKHARRTTEADSGSEANSRVEHG